MKKILLAVTAALAITGCSQNEEFEAPSQKAEINFNTAVTRATELDTGGLESSGFQVYAYNTKAEEMSAAVTLSTPWINGSATYSDFKWTVSGGPYYWPLAEKLKISGITSKNGRNDAKRLNIRVVTVSNDDKPKNRKTQRKADLRRRMVCKSLPVKE